MEEVFEFFASLEAKEIIITVAGIVASWIISKYFFNKRKPSVLEETKRFKTANFGSFRNVVKETGSTSIKSDFFGSWTIHDNGTVTDHTNNLTWLRAPWGTIWNGQHFIGDPMPLQWQEATDLFGKGIFVRTPFPTISLEQRPTKINENYTKGSCKVSFAGEDTWRLPTAAEADILQFYVPRELEIEKVRLLEKEAVALKQNLFPYLSAFSQTDILKYKLWTADFANITCGWSFHGTTLDDTQMKEKCHALFVRNSKSSIN